jgi:uncharacterized protein YcbK (DUF882 family)
VRYIAVALAVALVEPILLGSAHGDPSRTDEFPSAAQQGSESPCGEGPPCEDPSRTDEFRSAAQQGSESPCGEGPPCEDPSRTDEFPSKKARAALAKSTTHGPPPAPGKKPARLVNLHNTWTKEWLAVDIASPPPRDTIDRFLRDHFTNQPAAMEPKLVAIVLAAAAKFKSDVVTVVSGFRHPKYNLILRKKGHQVARESQHSHGKAIDFFLPRIATPRLHTWARAQRHGGVGFYARSGFVHVDTGPIRYWSGE